MSTRSAKRFSGAYIDVRQKTRSFLLTKMPASVLTDISYTAVRNIDDEEGAVQRILDRGRIRDVTKFTLGGGDFPASVILNWVANDRPIETKKRTKNLGMEFAPGSGNLFPF
ncbi:MAG: hypothetical protein KF774_09185 [Planctomyces sp.]|nr:hypothetical protein [Planctomyces sp.]